MNTGKEAHKASQMVMRAFAGASGRFATSSRPRFAPMGRAIGLARYAQIYAQIVSPAFRNLVKYPG